MSDGIDDMDACERLRDHGREKFAREVFFRDPRCRRAGAQQRHPSWPRMLGGDDAA